MADREATPGLSCDLFYTNNMCVSVYACMCVCLCVCLCACICLYICVRIFQLFQFQVAYRMKNGMCVYDCVCACVCVCAWQRVAHICLIALAAKGLTRHW